MNLEKSYPLLSQFAILSVLGLAFGFVMSFFAPIPSYSFDFFWRCSLIAVPALVVGGSKDLPVRVAIMLLIAGMLTYAPIGRFMLIAASVAGIAAAVTAVVLNCDRGVSIAFWELTLFVGLGYLPRVEVIAVQGQHYHFLMAFLTFFIPVFTCIQGYEEDDQRHTSLRIARMGPAPLSG